MMENDLSPSAETRGSSAALLAIYWAVVGIPLAWGIYNTWLKVKLLFA